MTTSPAPRPQRSTEAARAACQVVELLEVLWERGRDTATPSAVSVSQLRVMYSLEHDEGINLRRLGHLLGAAPSSVSRLCDRLEALGFVERTPSPVSRRELTLRLTQRGKSHLAELRSRREQMLLAPIGVMTPAARGALLEGLHDFRDALRAAVPDRADPAREHGPPPGSSRSA
ncbi:MarR family winged helix-turn-helix transcriptional regulator [Streptomyces sp. NPDC096176]|uniref:MarR family winged helix-turn-helix transcriptional regulator n=1 Tax=Streptomyces sp. NPDC096176 TaxID=3366079 RepID=UPI0037FF5AAB